MEEANIANRAKAQEFIQATSQVNLWYSKRALTVFFPLTSILTNSGDWKHKHMRISFAFQISSLVKSDVQICLMRRSVTKFDTSQSDLIAELKESKL